MNLEQIKYFDIQEQLTPTKETLIINFTPPSHTIKYEYIILKNNQEYKTITINNSLPTDIILDSTGKYQIKVTTYDNYNQTEIYNSGDYIIDKDKPYIILNESNIDMPLGTDLRVMEGVKAHDNQDGDLLDKVVTNYDELDFTTVGIKNLTYTVVDSAGNVATNNISINVYNARLESIFALQYIILGIILVLFVLIARYRRGIKLEKRVAKYSINPVQDDSLSLGDRLVSSYKKVIDNISNILGKSVFITKYSKRYNKYINVINANYFNAIDFVSEKILVSFLFLGMAFFAKLLQNEFLNYYDSIIPLIFGFFTPDIIYIFKFKRYRNHLENDFLQAITVMNNAFKSGRSIVQAIELVTNELDGPIAHEFEKMILEINFGLSIDVVFKRFADRIKLEEATYLTVALTILSKTGGNIIKVFSSIEKNLFNKKKLKLELKSLTGSSKLIVTILIGLPIFFVLVVNLINPNYFIPLYTTDIGKIILIIILTIYVSYIYVIQKFIKVRL
ncbi:MAG: type II secretion system F family protein [Bacilli bacterium]|nr:type II secretion system F family protein [Bacilli bacterium]MDD4282791.1 type II secretion system F family protein [Bacilli bacterium]MDD4719150.1 type II secretion system F family protein [Bacilli bacterium]